MRMDWKKIVIALVSVVVLELAIFTASGCAPYADSRKFDTLAIVLGVGIDYDEEQNQVLFTTQIVKTEEFEGGERFFNITESGNNVSQAVRNVNNVSDRVLYVAHNQVVVIGRSAAENGIEQYLDYFFRDDEARYDVGLVMTEGTSENLLDRATNLGSIPSQEITILVDNQEAMSECSRLQILDFAIERNSHNMASVMPIIGIEEAEENPEKIQFLVTGSGVFKEGKLAYTMDHEDTRGYLWGAGKVKNGKIILDDISVDILSAGSDFRTDVIFDEGTAKGRLVMEFNVNVKASLAEVSQNLAQNTQEIEKISLACEKMIIGEISDTVRASKEHNCDIFGAMDNLYRHNYRKWKQIEADWQSLYAGCDMRINVNVDIIRTGSLIEPIFGNNGN